MCEDILFVSRKGGIIRTDLIAITTITNNNTNNSSNNNNNNKSSNNKNFYYSHRYLVNL